MTRFYDYNIAYFYEDLWAASELDKYKSVVRNIAKSEVKVVICIETENNKIIANNLRTVPNLHLNWGTFVWNQGALRVLDLSETHIYVLYSLAQQIVYSYQNPEYVLLQYYIEAIHILI